MRIKTNKCLITIGSYDSSAFTVGSVINQKRMINVDGVERSSLLYSLNVLTEHAYSLLRNCGRPLILQFELYCTKNAYVRIQPAWPIAYEELYDTLLLACGFVMSFYDKDYNMLDVEGEELKRVLNTMEYNF